MERLERTSTVLRASGIFTAGLAALLVALGAVAALVMAHDGQITADAAPTFTTSASGTVKVAPTSATTRVSLEGCAPGPGASLQRLNARYATMSKAWRMAGISTKDLSRGNVVTQQRSRTRWCSTLDAVVTVDDLTQVDDVIDGIQRQSRGIQSIIGPRFDYDTANLERRAFDDAMRLARRKADDAARRSGMRVTGVRTITEQGTNVTRPEDEGVGIEPYPMAADLAVRSKQVVAGAIATHGGEATATATVQAVFTLEG